MALTDQLIEIADAIREKTGGSDKIPFLLLDDEIRRISEEAPEYNGAYLIRPNFKNQILETKQKTTVNNIEILPIDVTEVSNLSGGYTLSI